MKNIGLYLLLQKRACPPQVDTFKRLFGQYTEVTLEKCLKHAQELDFSWAIDHLIGHKEFERAWNESREMPECVACQKAFQQYESSTDDAYSNQDNKKYQKALELQKKYHYVYRRFMAQRFCELYLALPENGTTPA